MTAAPPQDDDALEGHKEHRELIRDVTKKIRDDVVRASSYAFQRCTASNQRKFQICKPFGAPPAVRSKTATEVKEITNVFNLDDNWEKTRLPGVDDEWPNED